ncbi:DUF2971 domain-containing protein [Psychrobacter okhotskensis]|nr:DUF2971 domain-containing protein [Psychrobacter okhotskensis]
MTGVSKQLINIRIKMLEKLSPHIVLTRYVSFVKLISMLEQGFFIPKANLFTDNWEGNLHLFNGEKDHFQTEGELVTAKDWVYVSCWYQDEPESHAMWNSYGQSDDSLAIQTTNGDLKSAYSASNFDPMCSYFGEVYYQQPDSAYNLYDRKKIFSWFSNNNDFSVNGKISNLTYRLYHKHKAFSFENEARLVLVDNDATLESNNDKAGIHLSVEHSREMIKKIILHPNSSAWFEDTVHKLIKDTYKLDIPIHKSSLIGSKN